MSGRRRADIVSGGTRKGEAAGADAAEGANLPRFQQVQLDFAAHLRNPDRNPAPAGIEPRRLRIYAELFYNNVEGFLSGTFPVVRSLLDDDAWHGLVRDFFDRHRSRSPLFLEIPEEFLAFLRDERAEGPRAVLSDPPWLYELCHYEWVELALDVADVTLPEAGIDRKGDLLDGVPVVSPLVETLGYSWPVHEIGPGRVPTMPSSETTWLLVHRDRAERVRFMVANAVTVRLLDLLRGASSEAGGEAAGRTGPTGREALALVAKELGQPASKFLEAGAALLGDLAKRDIILGTQCS
jgi:hypothetical protein